MVESNPGEERERTQMTPRFGDGVSEEMVMPSAGKREAGRVTGFSGEIVDGGVGTAHLWGNLLWSGIGTPGLKSLVPSFIYGME